MIFIDSNIPMYLIGAAHPHKSDARRLLERFVADKTPMVTDVEVFQEILHRYTAINRPEHIRPAFDVLMGLTEEVLSIERSDVERARDLILGKRKMSARDAIHVAVMERHAIKRVMSFDSDFDNIPGLTRIHS
ncbi:MAG TPA: type II toxin-antitoxin system VapC family toxin [Terriglobia bacterium]|nr:type II toxin-antitoxin system VapC family toxin [Terriglobia bacterium]